MKLQVSRIVLIIHCFILIIINLFTGIVVFQRLPHFYQELLEGEPLPNVADLVLQNGSSVFYIVSALLIVLTALIFIKIKKKEHLLNCGFVLLYSHLCLYSITIIGLSLPVIIIFEHLRS